MVDRTAAVRLVADLCYSLSSAFHHQAAHDGLDLDRRAEMICRHVLCDPAHPYERVHDLSHLYQIYARGCLCFPHVGGLTSYHRLFPHDVSDLLHSRALWTVVWVQMAFHSAVCLAVHPSSQTNRLEVVAVPFQARHSLVAQMEVPMTQHDFRTWLNLA